jgi:hypothetical protein
MTHPHFHAESSVKLWGGTVDDYLAVHDWLDATKETYADFRHRALRHHAQGIFEAERVFGKTLVNSDGRTVPVRYVAEQHIKEDCGGRIPSVSDWLSQIRAAPWMSRGYPPDARLAHLPADASQVGEAPGSVQRPSSACRLAAEEEGLSKE